MDNQILNTLNTVRIVRAGQLQAANLICLLVALIVQHRLSTKRHANLRQRYVREESLHDFSDDDDDDDNDDDDIQVVHSTPSPPEQSSNAKKYKSKKRKLEQEDEAFNSKVINCLDSLANAIREDNKILERICHREYTGEEIYKELEQMGLEPHDIPRALIYLAANQAKARTLFTCPFHLRMDVLKHMMGAGN